MGTFLPEKSCSSNRKRAVEEMIKGRDVATQLQNLLQKPCGGDGSVLAEELVVEILRSFTQTLFLMSSCCDESGEVCQIPATTTQVGSPSCGGGGGDLRSVDSGESSKMPAVKDRRGCYKRKKNTSETWITVSPTMEDSYAWRKYGQKQILKAKFPRCYFRCTHKPDQGCLATKQVQKIQEDPNMYQTKYFGFHTCRALASQNNIIIDSDDPVEPYLLSFGPMISSGTATQQDHQHLISSPPVPPMKEEYCKEEETQSNFSGYLSAPPVDSSIVWPDLMPLESSSSTGSQGFDMDFLIDIEPDDLANGFHFEESQLM
ncbi:hypothetical protein ACSBR2_007921 [Camellia fascicularis]